jgi:hypothetical protein
MLRVGHVEMVLTVPKKIKDFHNTRKLKELLSGINKCSRQSKSMIHRCISVYAEMANIT